MRRAPRPLALAALASLGCLPGECNPDPGGGSGGPGGVAGAGMAGGGGSSGASGSTGSGGAAGGTGGGASGAAGASGSGAGGTGSGGDAGGTAGGAGLDAGADADGGPVSLFCGDAIRDRVLEECDDGPGAGEDACTAECRAHNYLVVEPAALDAGARSGSRTLGYGRHPVASGPSGSIVAFVEKQSSVHELRASIFDEYGRRSGAAFDLGAGASPAESSDAVAAALPDGTFVIAWNDLAAGSLDVALRTVSPAGELGPVAVANQAGAGAQQDPDLLVTGGQLVAAWTDSFVPIYRRFQPDLTPIADEVALGASGSFGGSVALAAFGGSWAVAWRAIELDGRETIRVHGTTADWSVGPCVPGAPRERPALVELDGDHLLAVFTEGTDPTDSGTSSTTRIRAAVLDTAAPGPAIAVALINSEEPWASDSTLGESRPGLVRSGSRVYLTWQSESPLGDPLGDEIWFREIFWDGASPTLGDASQLQADAGRAEDQRLPALAASPLWPEGALVTVWEDSTSDPRHETLPDLVFGLRPTPIVVFGPGGR